jgi:hypothetical protein
MLPLLVFMLVFPNHLLDEWKEEREKLSVLRSRVLTRFSSRMSDARARYIPQTHRSLEYIQGPTSAETDTMPAQTHRSLDYIEGPTSAETDTMPAQTHRSLEYIEGPTSAETDTMPAQTHRSLGCCRGTAYAETDTMQALPPPLTSTSESQPSCDTSANPHTCAPSDPGAARFLNQLDTLETELRDNDNEDEDDDDESAETDTMRRISRINEHEPQPPNNSTCLTHDETHTELRMPLL